MIDTLLKNMPRFRAPAVCEVFHLQWRRYPVLTLHRPANVDEVDKPQRTILAIAVQYSLAVITDSGGITEGTTVMHDPFLTLKDNTERSETCTIGTNMLVWTNPDNYKPALDRLFSGEWPHGGITQFWDGHAAERIIEVLIR